MPHLLIHHKVRDFGKWKPFFDRHQNYRKISGAINTQLFQNVEDPNDVFVLAEWDSDEHARDFASSEDLKKTMEKAGVFGNPHILLLKKIQEYKT
jgi:heme-degrading monooxygenase HmoA